MYFSEAGQDPMQFNFQGLQMPQAGVSRLATLDCLSLGSSTRIFGLQLNLHGTSRRCAKLCRMPVANADAGIFAPWPRAQL